MDRANSRRQISLRFGRSRLVTEKLREAIEENQIEITDPDEFNGIYWMKINSEYHWQVILFEAKVGNSDLELSRSPSSVIFDSGSSLIYIPTKEYLAITTEIYNHKVCSTSSEDNFIYCPCEPNLDSLNGYPTL